MSHYRGVCVNLSPGGTVWRIVCGCPQRIPAVDAEDARSLRQSLSVAERRGGTGSVRVGSGVEQALQLLPAELERVVLPAGSTRDPCALGVAGQRLEFPFRA